MHTAYAPTGNEIAVGPDLKQAGPGLGIWEYGMHKPKNFGLCRPLPETAAADGPKCGWQTKAPSRAIPPEILISIIFIHTFPFFSFHKSAISHGR